MSKKKKITTKDKKPKKSTKPNKHNKAKKKNKDSFKSKNKDITVGLEETDKYLKAVLASPAGLGKTVLAATAADVPEMGQVFFGNTEKGTKSIKNSNAVKNYKDIIFYNMSTLEHLKKAQIFLLKHSIARDKYLDNKNKTNLKALQKINTNFGLPKDTMIYTFIVDSLTRLQERAIRDIRKNDARKYQSKRETADEKDSKAITLNYDAMELSHYGVNGVLFSEVIDKIVTLPMHIIIATGVKPMYEKLTNEEKLDRKRQADIIGLEPNMAGQVSTILAHHIDLVGFIRYSSERITVNGKSRRKNVRVLQLNDIDNNYYQCKTRISSDDTPYLIQPTIQKLLDLKKDND